MNIEKFQESKYYDDLLNAIVENGGGDWSHINQQFHCYVDESKEKHNQLQYTHYFTITSELMEGSMYIEMENGINNGAQIKEISFENDLKPKSRTIEVIKDVIIDEDRVVENGFSLAKAKLVFPSYKNKILELNRKSSYDNYFTGGGTNKTDNFYKNEFDKIRKMGLFWKYIYEEIEVDLNIV